MGFYFVSRPEPLSPAKRLETGLLMRRTRCDSAEIGPKTGPKNRRRAAGATPPDASKPASQLGSSSGASRTRTGGLLGAIQALASTEFGCLQGFAVVAARREARIFGQFPPISARIGPRKQGFGPISGLAELRPPYLPPVSQSAADAGRWLRAGAHLLLVRQEPTGVRPECRVHA